MLEAPLYDRVLPARSRYQDRYVHEGSATVGCLERRAGSLRWIHDGQELASAEAGELTIVIRGRSAVGRVRFLW